MPRIALGVEYDGTGYAGWQKQPHCEPTVQSVVERAISVVANHGISVVCAGRTDAGVHALGQVVHFDTRAERQSQEWVFGINANLPPDVRILWAQPVMDDFHARFSAAARYYRYEILNRWVKSAIRRDHVTTIFKPLDQALMQQAANLLLGQHDFSAYRATGCQAKDPVKTLHVFQVTRTNDLLYIDVIANAFLHHMVRNLVGVLLAIGRGTQTPEWAAEVLQSRDRRQAGITSPPNGLYLKAIYYPRRFGLPTSPAFDAVRDQIEMGRPGVSEQS